MKRAPNWTEAEIARVCELAAQGISARLIGEELGRSDDAVWLLKRKVPGLSFTAVGGVDRRQPPADFTEHAYDKIVDLKVRYGTSHAVICRWREQIGITRQMLRDHQAQVSGRKRLPIPDGFVEYQRDHTVAEVAEHFGISDATASRMFVELGINRRQQYNETRAAQKAQRKAAKPAPAPKPAASSVDRSAFIATGTVDRPHIDITPAGQAAEYLRRFGPVVRCDERGRYDPAGNRWRRGSALLTADEIIARAIRNGWSDGRMAA